MNKGLLPIGTVVSLKDARKKLMITGYYSKADDDDKIYTYNACIFPEGFMENTFCLFDANQIEEVYYMGLDNDEFKQYTEEIHPDVVYSSGNGLKFTSPSSSDTGKKRGRVPKAPTNPMSKSEMRAKYTTQKISGNQTEVFDFDKLK